MEVLITIKNYRCFSDSNPARIKIRKGFTAFIGVNNSGKSTLLKFFYEFRNIFESLAQSENFIRDEHKSQQMGKFSSPPEILDVKQVFCNKNNRPLIIEFEFKLEDNDPIDENITPPDNLIFTIKILRNARYTTSCKYKKKDITDVFANHEFQKKFSLIDSSLTGKSNITRNDHKNPGIVVPYIFEILSHLSNSVYIGSFRNAINTISIRGDQIGDIDYFDIKIGRQFIENWRELKESDNSVDNKKIIDVTEDTRRFFNFTTLEISPSKEDDYLKLIIDNNVYNLSEIGSGIAQFIVVIGNVAIQKPSYILIDEPELNLHPALQLDFLTTLANYASEGTLFATHSIGLARSSADCIYTVRKTSEGSQVSEYDKKSSLPELLGELSYSTYRELGFDKVLLVEGRSDIKTIQQFLRKYKQDQHILVLSLGGKDFINEYSIGELEEIKRISDQIYILIDSEKDSPDVEIEKCRKKFQENCQEIGIHCYILELRATENYFTDRAINPI